MSHLPKADKEQCGAFIVSVTFLLSYILNSKIQRDERVLVVWSDDLDHIVPLCNEFEEKLMKLVWRSRLVTSPSVTTSDSTPVTSTTASNVNLNEKATAARVSVTVAEAAVATAALTPLGTAAAPKKKFWGLGWRLSTKEPSAGATDPEKASTPPPRAIRLFAPLYGGLGSGLSICKFTNVFTVLTCVSNHPSSFLVFIASGILILLQEWRLDHDYTRFALLAASPFLVCVSLVKQVFFVIREFVTYHPDQFIAVLLMPNCNDDSHDVRFFHLKGILLDTLRFSSSLKASVLLRSSMKILVIILQCGHYLTRKSINIYPTLPLRCLFIKKVSKKLCKFPPFHNTEPFASEMANT